MPRLGNLCYGRLMRAAAFTLEARGDEAVLRLGGDWTATTLGRAAGALARALDQAVIVQVDDSDLGRFDTAGALALLQASRGRLPADVFAGRPESRRILELVARAASEKTPAPRSQDLIGRTLVKVGRGVAAIWDETIASLAFNGALLMAVFRTLTDPRRVRWPAWVSLAERAGLDAMPIVVVTNFFIGAVVAFLGADLLQQFGASVFAVELIGIAVLREFAVVITAVLLAGRSASSFAAELGTMKMNQEVDAMRVMGVDPFEALVLPRMMALLAMTPLLVFMAMLAGLFGGALVTWAKLDLSPAFFLQRIELNVGAQHFWVGLSKAPVFAVVVAAIGCRQGLSVGGDVESLGRRVTSAVVQAIFAIIALDAVFALIFLEMNV